MPSSRRWAADAALRRGEAGTEAAESGRGRGGRGQAGAARPSGGRRRGRMPSADCYPSVPRRPLARRAQRRESLADYPYAGRGRRAVSPPTSTAGGGGNAAAARPRSGRETALLKAVHGVHSSHVVLVPELRSRQPTQVTAAIFASERSGRAAGQPRRLSGRVLQASLCAERRAGGQLPPLPRSGSKRSSKSMARVSRSRGRVCVPRAEPSGRRHRAAVSASRLPC